VNIHHLELFYYVAKHGGIMEAVRKIPYGIQQPAVSLQIIQLERSLGTKLFQRRPFALTGEGRKLFEFIKPFFGDLAKVAGEISGMAGRFVRLGASGPVLRHHLPHALRLLREAIPGLSLQLSEGYEPQLMQMLKADEIDLAITAVSDSMPPGFGMAPLLSIPLALLLPAASGVRTPGDLWKRDSITESLITLPASDGIARRFQEGLQARGVDWPPGMVVSSLELIETYVAEGFGFGAVVHVPGMKPGPGVQLIPLPDFPPLKVGIVWNGAASPLTESLVAAFQRYVQTSMAA